MCNASIISGHAHACMRRLEAGGWPLLAIGWSGRPCPCWRDQSEPWERRQVLEAFACFWVTVDSFKGKKVESKQRVLGATAIKMHIEHPSKNNN